MKDNNQSGIFWTSYADLMTSLFFLMLVLFAVTFFTFRADVEQLRKLKEVENSVKGIDSTYFTYKPEYKKHILNIEVQFPKGNSDIDMLSKNITDALEDAGETIKALVSKTKGQDIKYLVIVEGQASRDGAGTPREREYNNYVLSYNRALALVNFWKARGIKLGEADLASCEVVIAGSGEFGSPRADSEDENQRFLIHIIPKIGNF